MEVFEIVLSAMHIFDTKKFREMNMNVWLRAKINQKSMT